MLDSQPHALDDHIELISGHDSLLWPGEALGRGRTNALWGLEHAVVYLQPLVVVVIAVSALLSPLELGGDLLCPFLEPCVDRLHIHT